MDRTIEDGLTDPATPPVPPSEGPGSEGQDVKAESSPATPDVPDADSSPADDVERKSLLDVAREAIAAEPSAEGSSPDSGQDPEKKDSGEPTTPETDAGKKSTEKEEDEKSPSDEEDDFADADKLEFGKHPRFQKLLRQWKTAREGARQFDAVQTFMREHGVSHEDAAQALKLAALLRGARRGSVEHAKLFLTDVLPVVTELRQLAGEEIAEDLRQKVTEGMVDEESAKELTQKRRLAEAATRRAEETAAASEARALSSLREKTAEAISLWERQTKARDPDYDKKQKLVMRAARAIAAEEGPPSTVREAVALVERAYTEVSELAESKSPSVNPADPARRVPSATSTPKALVRPEPKTLLDVVRQAVSR